MDEKLILENPSKTNPLNQDLILKLVLEYVGKSDINDLLECRLVSHSWNKMAVEVLEQNHYALELDYKKMLKFKTLLWNTQVSKVHADHQDLTSLRMSLSLNIHKEIRDKYTQGPALTAVEPELPEHRNEIANASQLLILHPQLRVTFLKCLVGKDEAKASDSRSSSDFDLTDSTDSDDDDNTEEPFSALTNHELFGLLKLTSNEITSFTLCCDVLRYANFEKFEFDCYLPLTFPKLTSIHYEVSSVSAMANDLDFNTHVLSIINRAPKLTNFKVHIWKNDANVSPKTLQPLIQASSANLEQLELHFEEINGLVVLSEMKFPCLTTLKLRSGGKMSKFTTEFKQFLEHHSSLLSSLEMNFVWTLANEMETRAESLEMIIPVLPNVLHFGFYPGYSEHLERVKAVHTTFNQMMPSLNSVSMELEVLLALGKLEIHLRRSGRGRSSVPTPEQFPIFLNISKLEIRISPGRNLRNVMLALMYEARCIFNHIFPCITKLVISPSPNTNGSSLARNFSQADMDNAIVYLCYHPGIQTLEMRNYAQPWLEQMLKYKFEGVKCLKLFPLRPSTTTTTTVRGKCPAAELDVLKILTQFPTLEYFQFGKAKICGSEIQAIRKTLERVDWFKSSALKKGNN